MKSHMYDTYLEPVQILGTGVYKFHDTYLVPLYHRWNSITFHCHRSINYI